jgi:hypothetical protein
VQQDHKDLQALLDLTAQLVLAQQDHKDHKVLLGLTAQLAQQELQSQLLDQYLL